MRPSVDQKKETKKRKETGRKGTKKKKREKKDGTRNPNA